MKIYDLNRTRPLTSDAMGQVPVLPRLLGGVAGLLFLLAFASGAWAQNLGLTTDGKVPGNPFQVIQGQIDFFKSKGPTGEIGPTGSQGPTGDPGPIGDKGPIGDMGLIGMKGPVGDPGPDGAQGDVGPQGPPGGKGPIGDPGSVGDPGQLGTDGNQGPTGILEAKACLVAGQVLVGFDALGNLNCSS